MRIIACKTMLQHFGLARYLLWNVYEMRDRAYGNNLYVLFFFAFLKKVIKKTIDILLLARQPKAS